MIKKAAIVYSKNNNSNDSSYTPNNPSPGGDDNSGGTIVDPGMDPNPQMVEKHIDIAIPIYCLNTGRLWNATKNVGGLPNFYVREDFLDNYITHTYSTEVGDKNIGDVDWFFNTFVLGDLQCSHSAPSIRLDGVGDSGNSENATFNSVPANKAVWRNYIINSLNEGGSMYELLNSLNTKIEECTDEIGPPPTKRKWMIGLPTACFTTRDNSGRIRNIINTGYANKRTFDIALVEYFKAGYADGGRWPFTLNPDYYTSKAIHDRYPELNFSMTYGDNQLDPGQLVDVVKGVVNGTYDATIEVTNPTTGELFLAGNKPIKCSITSANTDYIRKSYGLTRDSQDGKYKGTFNIDGKYWNNDVDVEGHILTVEDNDKLDFSNDEDIVEALKWFVDEVEGKVNNLNFPNIEFGGFYMISELPTFSYSVNVINSIIDYIHSKGYKLCISPYPSYYNLQYNGNDVGYNIIFPKKRLSKCNFDNVYYLINRGLNNTNTEDLSLDMSYIKNDNLDVNFAFNSNSYSKDSNINTFERLSSVLSTAKLNKLFDNCNIMCYDDAGEIYKIYKSEDFTYELYMDKVKKWLDDFAYNATSKKYYTVDKPIDRL